MHDQQTLPFADDAEARFQRFHAAHPEVYGLFVKLAWRLKRAGWRHYSARGLIFEIRFQHDVNPDRDGGFKINDHCSSHYARMLMANEPESFAGFFETRKLATEKG